MEGYGYGSWLRHVLLQFQVTFLLYTFQQFQTKQKLPGTYNI